MTPVTGRLLYIIKFIIIIIREDILSFLILMNEWVRGASFKYFINS